MLRFHHVGVACESIADETAIWTSLGYNLEDESFEDEAQGIRGQFMTGNGPRIELLEATSASTTLTPWLKRRVKLYHMGYLVDSFDISLEKLIKNGASIVRNPMISTYFKSRIAFLMLSNLMLVEIIESSKKSNACPRSHFDAQQY